MRKFAAGQIDRVIFRYGYAMPSWSAAKGKVAGAQKGDTITLTRARDGSEVWKIDNSVKF